MPAIYIVHKEYPFGEIPRIETKYRPGFPEGENIGTPNISYEEIGKKDIPKRNCLISFFDRKRLWKKFLREYRRNIKTAESELELIELPADSNGNTTDFSLIEDGEIYIGGCFLDGCVRNAIRDIQTELCRIGKNPVVSVVPELTLCYLQPAQVTFEETIKDINKTNFFPLRDKMTKKEIKNTKPIRHKVRKAGLDSILNI